jgi:hypothetical protein
MHQQCNLLSVVITTNMINIGGTFMDINIRYETVSKMLLLCRKHKDGVLKQTELEELLDHEDYKLEFQRYNQKGMPMCGITKEEFIDYFMNFFSLDIADIKNERLKMHHEQYTYLFNNLDFYENEIKKLNTLNVELFKEGLKYTFNGLPKEINFEKLDFIFTISIGNSFGWFYDNCSHFDIINFFRIIDMNIFRNYIGHEVHHLGMNKYTEKICEKDLSLEEHLYLFLSFEGLAVKYCNNGQGALTNPIYNETPNIGMDDFTWKYFEKDFSNIYNNFKLQIKSIREGKIKDIDELNDIIANYWLNLYTYEQDKSEVPKLMHSRNYYFGCNIWGLIHDIYGKDKVYEVMNDLKQFPEVFNNALKSIGKEELCI